MIEKQLIGCILSDNACLPKITEFISPDDFLISENKIVFQKIIEMTERGLSVDFVSLGQALNRPPGHLTHFVEDLPSKTFLDTYIKQFRDELMDRKYMGLVSSLSRIKDRKQAVNEMIDFCQLESLEYEKPYKEYISTFHDEYAENAGKRGIIGLLTGFPWIDKFVRFDKRMLITIAARPGCGKTAFSLCVAIGMAKQEAVTFFSLEMEVRDIILRGIAATQDIPLTNLIRYEHENISGAMGRWCDETKNLTIRRPRICNLRTIEAEAQKTKVIFIDQLSKINEPMLRGESRATLYGRITTALCNIAAQNNCCIILCAQINRTGTEEPTLVHLKDSGSIEEDSNIVLLLKNDPMTNECIVTCAKNRSGEEGAKRFAFYRNFTKFVELKNSSSVPSGQRNVSGREIKTLFPRN